MLLLIFSSEGLLLEQQTNSRSEFGVHSPIPPCGSCPTALYWEVQGIQVPQQGARWETCPQKSHRNAPCHSPHLTSRTTGMAASHQGKRDHFIKESCVYKFPCYKDGMARVLARRCILGTFHARQESVPKGWLFSGLLLPWSILFPYLWKSKGTGGVFYLPVNAFIQRAPWNSQWRRVDTLERN